VSDDEDVTFWLGQLGSTDARARVRSLHAIAEKPVADPRLLAACEKLLADREVCLIQIPYRFGEVRVVAADAVSALRGKLGIPEPVIVADGFMPLTTDDVARLARAAGLPMQAAVDGTIATLRELVAHGRVPTRTITR
jgi:hypothetical protein